MKACSFGTWLFLIAFETIASDILSLSVSATRDGDMRLAGSNKPNQGRVEIYYGGQWGTVCDDNWDLDDAVVVCYALGFVNATSARLGAVFGKGSGPILLDDVFCKGTESSLASCKHRGWGVHDCQHSEDAGVECLDSKKETQTGLQTYELDHSSDFSWYLNKLYDSKQGCDFYFLIQTSSDTSMTVCTHKLILSMNSEATFLANSGTDNYTLTVEEACLPYVDDFIRYLYSKRIKITLSSAQCIHKMASSYGVKDLQEYCGQLFSRLLLEDPTFKSQVGFYNYARATGDILLEELCLQYLAWNCEAFSNSLAWFNLSAEQLNALLARSDLVIPSELSLLQALEKWTLNTKTTKTEAVRDLINQIRFPMMPPEVLFEAQFNLTFYKGHEDLFHSKYVQALVFHTVPFQKLKQRIDMSDDRYTPRIYTSTWGYLYNESSRQSTKTYSSRSDHGVVRYRNVYPQYGQVPQVVSSPSISFNTPKHSSFLFNSQTMSWSLAHHSSSESCRNSGSSCPYDTYPVLTLSPQSSIESTVQYQNKVLMICNGSYVADVQDFKNNVAVVPVNGSYSLFPCSSKYSVFRYIVRPVYFRN